MSKLTREGFHAMHEQAAEALERSRSSLNVLICAGTGCIASGSMKVSENLREECAQRTVSAPECGPPSAFLFLWHSYGRRACIGQR